MQISIKPICDWTICLTASADEQLACLKQTSFHSTTSLMDPLLATVAQNRIIANSGCLQIQQNKFPDFQEILYKIPVDFFLRFFGLLLIKKLGTSMVTNAGDDSEPVYPVNVQYGGHFKHKMAQPVS